MIHMITHTQLTKKVRHQVLTNSPDLRGLEDCLIVLMFLVPSMMLITQRS